LPGNDGDLSGIALATTEAGDIGFIVDGAGNSQAKKGPFEARSGFPTEPRVPRSMRAGHDRIAIFMALRQAHSLVKYFIIVVAIMMGHNMRQ